MDEHVMVGSNTEITDPHMTVTITKTEYYDLRVAAEKLLRLENGGVDNWTWYSESLNPDDVDMEAREEEIRKEIWNCS